MNLSTNSGRAFEIDIVSEGRHFSGYAKVHYRSLVVRSLFGTKSVRLQDGQDVEVIGRRLLADIVDFARREGIL